LYRIVLYSTYFCFTLNRPGQQRTAPKDQCGFILKAKAVQLVRMDFRHAGTDFVVSIGHT